MNDLLTSPTKAEKRALWLAEYLMRDEQLAPFFLKDKSGKPALFWTESQTAALTALMGSYNAAIIPWHPTLEQLNKSADGSERIMRVTCPIVVAVSALLGDEAMPACHRLATALLRQGHSLGSDASYTGEQPAVLYVGPVSMSELGQKFKNTVAQVIQFSFLYKH